MYNIAYAKKTSLTKGFGSSLDIFSLVVKKTTFQHSSIHWRQCDFYVIMFVWYYNRAEI